MSGFYRSSAFAITLCQPSIQLEVIRPFQPTTTDSNKRAVDQPHDIVAQKKHLPTLRDGGSTRHLDTSVDMCLSPNPRCGLHDRVPYRARRKDLVMSRRYNSNWAIRTESMADNMGVQQAEPSLHADSGQPGSKDAAGQAVRSYEASRAVSSTKSFTHSCT